MRKAIVKTDIEANDGTRIRKGETVDVTFPLFYEPSDGRVTVRAGRRYINGVDIKELELKEGNEG